ncbi:putative ferric-chelate reductase 1 [Saccoglossus kowalevskii]|uniref:Ferric-chelate reductase 1-like n=1 Tax=Saccoglossus kowalevskii TaxID=10224 RepID=A0ABM0H1K5_SACKO|nr:PREDICTED: putative ferric-chelate reductase 1-like [Saccoglossus kowalevskii]
MRNMLMVLCALLAASEVWADEANYIVTSSGCGETKGCFSIPEGCTNKDDCDVFVSWQQGSDSTIQIELLGRMRMEYGDSYIGVGFSKEQMMNNDDVWACLFYQDTLHFDHSYNKGKSNVPQPISEASLASFSGMYFENSIQCTFNRPMSVDYVPSEDQGANITFDLNDPHYLLIPRGPLWSMNGFTGKGKHMTLPIITAKALQLDGVQTYSEIMKRPIMLKVHACLMISGWMGLASIAIIFARYFKLIWPNSKLCGEKVWFAFHRFLMMLNFCCFITAFVIIFVYLGGFVHYKFTTQPKFIHAVCGIVTVALGFLNPILALLRPHPGTVRRPYFNWAHWVVGMSAYILALACIFIGIDLEKMDLPKYTTWTVVGFVAFHVMMEVLLKLVIGIVEGAANRRSRSQNYEMSPAGSNGVKQDDHDELKPNLTGSTYAVILLVIHVFGVIGIVTSLVVTTALM